MTSCTTHLICDPPFESWKEHLAQNNDARSAKHISQEELLHIRKEIFRRAHSYTEGLMRKVGGELELPADEGETVIMAGHQPLIYHSGILAKNLLLADYVQTNKDVVAINVIIDTDSGDAGQIYFPVKKGGRLSIEKSTLSSSEGVFLYQQLLDRAELSERFALIEGNLRTVGFSEAADKVKTVAGHYLPFAGGSIVEANTIIRRHYADDHTTLEIPLSHLLDIPPLRRFYARLLSNYATLHNFYNGALDLYRAEHKIKNLANPFPNLLKDGGRMELPFWIIQRAQQTREPLAMAEEEGRTAVFSGRNKIAVTDEPGMEALIESLAPQYFIAPKAVLITAMLRLFCCDLFVHGRGGGKYDAFTDIFIADYLKLDVPCFAVASANRYLFATEVAELEESRRKAELRRDMLYHIERHLDDEIFPAEQRARLRNIVAERDALVRTIRELKSNREASGEITRKKRALEAEVKQIVDARLGAGEGDARTATLESMEKIYFFREFPFFYFCDGP